MTEKQAFLAGYETSYIDGDSEDRPLCHVSAEAAWQAYAKQHGFYEVTLTAEQMDATVVTVPPMSIEGEYEWPDAPRVSEEDLKALYAAEKTE